MGFTLAQIACSLPNFFKKLLTKSLEVISLSKFHLFPTIISLFPSLTFPIAPHYLRVNNMSSLHSSLFLAIVSSFLTIPPCFPSLAHHSPSSTCHFSSLFWCSPIIIQVKLKHPPTITSCFEQEHVPNLPLSLCWHGTQLWSVSDINSNWAWNNGFWRSN